VTRFIEERPVTRVAMELGCTRSPFLQSVAMDPFGTNGAALTSRLTIKDICQAVNGARMSHHEAILAYSQDMSAKPYEQQFLPMPHELAEAVRQSQRLVFLPLQLYDDANLLR